MDLNTLLFAGKWAFIALVYFILIVVVIVVRREMSVRSGRQLQPALVVPGRLKVVSAGSDARFHPGDFCPLKPENNLGNKPDNDLLLNDQFVSGHHACLRWDGSAWWIEDLGSTNGTTVDDKPCLPHKPQAVPPGARLVLGDMIFELVA